MNHELPTVSATTVPVRIREASTDDYAAICTLLEQVDRLHLAWYPEYFRQPDGPRRDFTFIQQWIGHPDGAILLALDPAGLVGLAMLLVEQAAVFPILLPNRARVVIENLVVDEGHLRQGVGHQLVSAATDWARARGIGELQLQVYAKNETARQFYEAEGFGMLSVQLRKFV
ncbi:MAG: hypothetical protein OHK0039_30720 [Bacteroidia bacterium]